MTLTYSVVIKEFTGIWTTSDRYIQPIDLRFFGLAETGADGYGYKYLKFSNNNDQFLHFAKYSTYVKTQSSEMLRLSENTEMLCTHKTRTCL